MAIALYAFLGLGLYLLWRDLRRQSELLAARQYPPLSLCLAGETHGRAYTQPELFLGRGSTCDFVVDDPTVSLQHARLSFRQGQWWLEDLASTNGTFLNGEAVQGGALLTNQDEIRLGQAALLVTLPET
jgi:predicted component of type VI protein secretion system